MTSSVTDAQYGASLFHFVPTSVFAYHVYSTLTEEDRRALRSVCRESRAVVNGEVKSACVPGSLLGKLTLQRIMGTCKQLKSLRLMDEPDERVCGELLASFINDFKAPGSCVKSLDIKECNFIQATDLHRLILACPSLTSLRASRCADGSHLQALLPLANYLTELDLGHSFCNIISVTDTSLSQLPQLPTLRSVRLNRCIEVTDKGVAHLCASRMPNLNALDLSSTRVTGTSGFKTLAGLSSLVLLDCRSFGDAGLAALCGHHGSTLRALFLHGTAVHSGGASLSHLSQAARLEVLDLGRAWEMDSDGLLALSNCRALSDMRLGNFNLRQSHHKPQRPTPDGLQPCSPMAVHSAPPGSSSGCCLPSIMRLSLGGMFGQQGLQRLLKRLPRLKRLELSGLNTATDQVLAQLMGSSGSGGDGGSAASLEELHLARGGPELTPEGLMQLVLLPGLRLLTLVDCPCAAADSSVQRLVNAVRSRGRELQVEVVGKPDVTSGIRRAVGSEMRLVERMTASIHVATAPKLTMVSC